MGYTSGKYGVGRIGRTNPGTPSPFPPNVAGFALGVPVDGLTKWGVDANVAELKATTARHMGFSYTEGGIADATVTLELLCDATVAHAFSLPGAIFVDFRLYKSGFNTAPDYQFPQLVLLSAPYQVEIEGQVRLTARLKNQGPFRGPGQTEWTAANIVSILAGDYASVFA